MITVFPVKDREELKKIFSEFNLTVTDFSGAVLARFGEERLGVCLYEITADQITIIEISPINDVMLADGILRSALHVADFRGINKAYYKNESLTELLSKLDFIKNSQENSLKIEKLHQSSCNCEKNNK